MKTLQAERARAALVFEKKCKNDKSSNRNENEQNDEKKKKQKKREKVLESEQKGKFFICIYFRS